MLVQRQTVPIYHVVHQTHTTNSFYRAVTIFQVTINTLVPMWPKWNFRSIQMLIMTKIVSILRVIIMIFHYTVDGTLKMHLLLVLVGTLLILLLHL